MSTLVSIDLVPRPDGAGSSKQLGTCDDVDLESSSPVILLWPPPVGLLGAGRDHHTISRWNRYLVIRAATLRSVALAAQPQAE